MKKRNALTGTLILLFVCFAGVSVFLTVMVIRDAGRVRLAETGERVWAETLEMDSSLTVNDVHYYALRVRFEDENGEHTGWTGSSFLYEEARAILDEGQIEICVDEHYNLIEAGYAGSPSATVLKILQLVFGLVAVGLMIPLVRQVLGAFRSRRLMREGSLAEGQVLKSGSDVTVNGCPLYYLKLSFSDRDGNYREFRTVSRFSREERDLLTGQELLPIRYDEKAATLDLNALKEKGVLK